MKVAKHTELGLRIAARVVSVKYFERDPAPELRVLCLVHRPGSSPPDTTGEGEVPQLNRCWGTSHEP